MPCHFRRRCLRHAAFFIISLLMLFAIRHAFAMLIFVTRHAPYVCCRFNTLLIFRHYYDYRYFFFIFRFFTPPLPRLFILFDIFRLRYVCHAGYDKLLLICFIYVIDAIMPLIVVFLI